MDYNRIATDVARQIVANFDTETMTLDEFEAAGHEPWQVTQGQWVDIMQRYTHGLNQAPDQASYRNYHKESVTKAIADGKTVSDAVLRDYPALTAEVTEQQKQADDFRHLVVGDPISVKINYFGTMADGFFVGFFAPPKDDKALVYVKVKGRSRPMRFGQHEIFVREGKKPTSSQMKAIRKWRDALDQGLVA